MPLCSHRTAATNGSVSPTPPADRRHLRLVCQAGLRCGGALQRHRSRSAAGADGVERQDVQYLEYEAYDEMVVPKLAEIAAETRARWSEVGRIAMIHRVGRLELGESSVVCAVSAPHRPQAFVAARFAIDALKVSVPVWKREVWPEGSDWGTNAADLVDVADVPVSASSEVDT
ncbi:MAG: molybdenum cofactor biosynthesis protein MoaE [Ilumatobacteraceae bacterium]